jgi:hypothetical protein
MPDLTSIVLKSMEQLSTERPIFHSEADFQLALAWMLQRQHPAARLRLERRILEHPRVELDVFMTIEDKRFGLELKYPRSTVDVEVAGERFFLRTGAPDIESHGVLRDVERLERLIREDAIDQGCAVVLTNAARFWIPPPEGRVTNYDAFRIHDGHRLEGVADWGIGAGAGVRTGHDPIVLSGSYPLAWRDYASFPGVTLRYLIIQVGADARTQ